MGEHPHQDDEGQSQERARVVQAFQEEQGHVDRVAGADPNQSDDANGALHGRLLLWHNPGHVLRPAGRRVAA